MTHPPTVLEPDLAARRDRVRTLHWRLRDAREALTVAMDQIPDPDGLLETEPLADRVVLAAVALYLQEQARTWCRVAALRGDAVALTSVEEAMRALVDLLDEDFHALDRPNLELRFRAAEVSLCACAAGCGLVFPPLDDLVRQALPLLVEALRPHGHEVLPLQPVQALDDEEDTTSFFTEDPDLPEPWETFSPTPTPYRERAVAMVARLLDDLAHEGRSLREQISRVVMGQTSYEVRIQSPQHPGILVAQLRPGDARSDAGAASLLRAQATLVEAALQDLTFLQYVLRLGPQSTVRTQEGRLVRAELGGAEKARLYAILEGVSYWRYVSLVPLALQSPESGSP